MAGPGRDLAFDDAIRKGRVAFVLDVEAKRSHMGLRCRSSSIHRSESHAIPPRRSVCLAKRFADGYALTSLPRHEANRATSPLTIALLRARPLSRFGAAAARALYRWPMVRKRSNIAASIRVPRERMSFSQLRRCCCCAALLWRFCAALSNAFPSRAATILRTRAHSFASASPSAPPSASPFPSSASPVTFGASFPPLARIPAVDSAPSPRTCGPPPPSFARGPRSSLATAEEEESDEIGRGEPAARPGARRARLAAAAVAFHSGRPLEPRARLNGFKA